MEVGICLVSRSLVWRGEGKACKGGETSSAPWLGRVACRDDYGCRDRGKGQTAAGWS